MTLLEPMPLEPIKWAFTTRRVRRSVAAGLRYDLEASVPGDVIVAEVSSIGQHTGLQLINGRRATLHKSDLVAVCVGARYAPDQFESEARIESGTADLAASGGIAGIVVRKHKSVRHATRLRVLGRVADVTGRPLNIRDFALTHLDLPVERPPVFAVLGSSMNAGKTVATASIARGLARAGFRVAACKATGTGACGDLYAYRDAGAHCTLDFTDLGYASTSGLSQEELEAIYQNLIAHACGRGATAIVIEIADGLLQRETAMLIESVLFRKLTRGVVFAAGDALGAIRGAEQLGRAALPVAAVTGCLTLSPLAVDEARANLSVPIVGKDELCTAEFAPSLIRMSAVHGDGLAAA